MNIFKSSILAVSAICAVAFTACSDDDNYTPASPAGGVYFSKETPAEYELPKDKSSFDVEIYRSGLTDAASYAVSVSCDDATPFTIPTQAVFEQGSDKGTITIGYDVAKLDPAKTYKFAVTLAEGSPLFAFGAGEFTFTAILKPNFGEWKPFGKEGYAGTGVYSYDLPFLFEGKQEMEVYIRYNEENPTQAQIMFKDWGFGYTEGMILDYDTQTNICHIPFGFYTGVNVNIGGTSYPLYVTDLYTYLRTVDWPDLTPAQQQQVEAQYKGASFYDPETGTFNIYMYYYVPYSGSYSGLQDGDGYDTFLCAGFKSYDLSVEFNGSYTEPDGQTSYAVINTSVSADAASAKLLLRRGMTAEQVLAEIVAGAEDAVDLTPGEDQQNLVQLAGPGTYVAVVAAFDKGEVARAIYTEFEVTGVGEDPNLGWTECGIAQICDPWIMSRFSFRTEDGGSLTYRDPALQWRVKVQQKDDLPGYYRLVALWTTPECVLNNPQVMGDGGNANTKQVNIEVDATNEQCVVIAPQYSGFTMVEKGEATNLWISNLDGFFTSEIYAQANKLDQPITKEEVIAAGQNTIWDDGYIAIDEAIVGYGPTEFGYTWKDNPAGEIMISLGEPSQIGAAKIAQQIQILRNGRANFAARKLAKRANINFSKTEKKYSVKKFDSPRYLIIH